jgi:hypothetical protein
MYSNCLYNLNLEAFAHKKIYNGPSKKKIANVKPVLNILISVSVFCITYYMLA